MNFKALTSLRFFPAMIVVVYHFKDVLKTIKIENYTYLFSRSVIVEFFFILSGFIITHVYYNSIKKNEFKLYEFLIKRIARLYPIHLITLIFFIIMGIIISVYEINTFRPERYDPNTIVSNILMLHGWGIEKRLSYNFPSWTVSAEWFAYLMFYPIMWLILKLKERISICVFISVFLLVFLWSISKPVFHRALTSLSYDFSIIRILPEFIIGITLYLIFLNYRIKLLFVKPLIFLSILIFIISFHFKFNDFVSIFSYCLIIISVAETTRNALNIFLNNNYLVYLGEISYSIYMVQAVVESVYFNGLKIILKNYYYNIEIYLWLFSFVVVIAVAAIAYHLIEKPARQFINNHYSNIFYK